MADSNKKTYSNRNQDGGNERKKRVESMHEGRSEVRGQGDGTTGAKMARPVGNNKTTRDDNGRLEPAADPSQHGSGREMAHEMERDMVGDRREEEDGNNRHWKALKRKQ